MITEANVCQHGDSFSCSLLVIGFSSKVSAETIATEILQGELFVSSEQGKGSRFSLRIPVRVS